MWNGIYEKAETGPLLTHIVDDNAEMIRVVRWRQTRITQEKKFGLKEWISIDNANTYWFRTQRGRDNALKELKAERRNRNKIYERIVRGNRE